MQMKEITHFFTDIEIPSVIHVVIRVQVIGKDQPLHNKYEATILSMMISHHGRKRKKRRIGRRGSFFWLRGSSYPRGADEVFCGGKARDMFVGLHMWGHQLPHFFRK